MRSLLAVGGRAPRLWATALALPILWGLAGCGRGDGLDRQPVSGSVTLDGAPLDTGMIRFLPESADATTETSTAIEGGKYSFPKDTGPVPGAYKVVISSAKGEAFEPPQGKMPGEVHPPLAKEKVPEKYNVTTELTATVKRGETAPIDFALTSK